jgi:hypothetical protein
MTEIITFAYLRQVKNMNEENVLEVFAVADYFCMLGLMKMCVDFTINMLRPENCVGIMLFAR